jgi:hypothetical protein
MSAGHVRTTAEDLASQQPRNGKAQNVEATFRSPGRVTYGPLRPASCIIRIEDIRSWRPEGRRYVGFGTPPNLGYVGFDGGAAPYLPFAVRPAGSRS